MTIYFMGGEMSALTPSDSDNYEYSSGTYWNSSFARCAIRVNSEVTYAETPDIGDTLTDAWVHLDLVGGIGAQDPALYWYDDSGTARVRLNINGDANTMTLYYDVGAGFVSAGSISVGVETLQTVDLNVLCDTATGHLKLYLSGTLRIDSGTVDLSAITELNKARCYGSTATSIDRSIFFSQIIIADEPTIGWRLVTRYPNAAGATSSWTGTYTDIDEIRYSDADFINSATNGQVSTFGQTGPAISGYTVRAVGVYARAKKGASGPENLQLALRVSGTDYFSASKALDVGYAAYGNIWETNPATAAAWVSTAIDAIQPGVKAIT